MYKYVKSVIFFIKICYNNVVNIEGSVICMNQEKNNLNPNNFNTQGNNGITNNQLLNNQSFNQGMSFNQQPINPQQQPTPSFQQPIMQKPTLQPMNTFETGSANNQNFNRKPPKKKNLGLIIGIVVFIVIIGLIVGFVIIANKKDKKPTEEIPQAEKNTITKDEIVEIERRRFR